jgi:tripartite-type tricarboxylate transporter receptor subunit TctC
MICCRPRYALAAIFGALLLPFALATSVRAYPDQLIRIIVTFPPGGSADIVIRALEPIVARDLKQSFVIENRAGAGGNIGMAVVAQARPDGYTLGIAPAGALTVNPHLNHNMPFDPRRIQPVVATAEKRRLR